VSRIAAAEIQSNHSWQLIGGIRQENVVVPVDRKKPELIASLYKAPYSLKR
jgi:hypothetical protein